MGYTINLIHSACKEIVNGVSLIYYESFMFHIFDELREERPDFDEYLMCEFENKMMLVGELFIQQTRTTRIVQKC